MDVTKQLLGFASFLDLSWDLMLEFIHFKFTERDEAERYVDIFIQANWELLVERSICNELGQLEYYGDGADLRDTSNRVIVTEKDVNFKIVCSFTRNNHDLISKRKINLEFMDFHKFASYDGDGYSHNPPFEYVILKDNDDENYLFKIDDVSFKLVLL